MTIGPYTVRECIGEYVAWLEAHRKTAADARYRVNAHAMPTLGDIQCAKLTTAQIQNWLRDLAGSIADEGQRQKAECTEPGQERS